MINNDENRCLHCNKKIIGRTDKKYCNDYCRSAYHNSNANSDQSYIRNINKQLRKNRSALRLACPMGKATVPKTFLKKLGMDFKFFTHTWKSQGGVLYFFCYDYSYTQANDPEKLLIIQQQPYMDNQEAVNNQPK